MNCYDYLPSGYEKKQIFVHQKEYASLSNNGPLMLTNILKHCNNGTKLKRTYSGATDLEAFDPFFHFEKTFLLHIITTNFSDITKEQLKEAYSKIDPKRQVFKKLLLFISKTEYKTIQYWITKQSDILEWFVNQKKLEQTTNDLLLEEFRLLINIFFISTSQRNKFVTI